MAVAEDSAAVRRYAGAVFELARDTGAVDQWQSDLQTIAAVGADMDAVSVLQNQKAALDDRIALAERAMAGLSPGAINLAKLLITRSRFHLAPAITEAFAKLVDQARGVVRAEVVTAVSLSPEDLTAITARLRELTGATDVRVAPRVDPSIIGGLVVRIGDRLIDGSTRTRLLQLKRQLAGSTR